jgi:hypothetical protein
LEHTGVLKVLAPIALLLALSGPPAADEIVRKLEAWQPTLLYPSLLPPTYVVRDRWPGNHKPRTIFAVVTTNEGTQQLVAFRVDSNGSLRPLSSYGHDARRVEQRDVTGDGVAEVLLTLSPGNRSAAVEILQWDGRRFRSIGDTSNNAEFIDLDGDGVPEIVERTIDPPNSCHVAPARIFVQQLHDAEFEENRFPRLEYVFRYEKKTDEPERFAEEWPLPDAFPLHSRVRVFNGTPRGVHRAKGISIRLRELSDIKGTTTGRSVPLALTADRRDSEARVPLQSRCIRAWITVEGPAGAVVTGLLEADAVPSADRIR